MAPLTTYEFLVGLNVTDDASYTRYRAGMTPILEECGGSFRYDFRVGEVLKNEDGQPINRLFVITFPDRATSESFFADPNYLAVRSEFFGPAVESTTIISAYERAAE